VPPDFRELKRVVSIERVLRARNLFALRPRGRRLVGPCPLHGGDNPTAFVVDGDKGLWHCFTRCGAGGDVVELVRRLDRCGYRQAALELARLAQLDADDVPVRVATPVGVPRPFRPFTSRLELDATASLLGRKGIQPATARAFDVGAWLRPGFLHRCIGVRLHDPAGRPLGYAGRRLDNDEAKRFGKWKLPPAFPKSEVLYGYHRVRDRLSDGLVVVECPWGVMRLAQLGIPAVALLGVVLHGAQRDLLTQSDRVLLLLDGDDAGTRGATAIRAALADHVPVAIAQLPPGLDPDDLEDAELRRRTSSFLGRRYSSALNSSM